jgi:ribosome maturation factor RimP
MVGWSHCLALTLPLVAGVQSFFVPASSFVGPSVVSHGRGSQPHIGEDASSCGCPACVAGLSSRHHHHGAGAGAGAGAGVASRRDAVVMLARGRRGRGGGGWARRRRQDANPVEFDNYGFPIPPKKSAKELEEEHRKWMESIEPPEGFANFDPEAEGFTAEDITSHPLADPAAAESAAAAAAAAASAQAAAAAAAAEEGDGSGLEEYEPDYDDIPEWGGELLGMDDPLDAPWRLKGEELIRAAVAEAGFETYDVTWHLHHLNIDVERGAGEEQGSLSSDEIVEVTRSIEEALFPHDRELRILQRFHLCVGTPGAKDVLTTEREFQAFRGYEVHVVVRALLGLAWLGLAWLWNCCGCMCGCMCLGVCLFRGVRRQVLSNSTQSTDPIHHHRSQHTPHATAPQPRERDGPAGGARGAAHGAHAAQHHHQRQGPQCDHPHGHGARGAAPRGQARGRRL